MKTNILKISALFICCISTNILFGQNNYIMNYGNGTMVVNCSKIGNDKEYREANVISTINRNNLINNYNSLYNQQNNNQQTNLRISQSDLLSKFGLPNPPYLSYPSYSVISSNISKVYIKISNINSSPRIEIINNLVGISFTNVVSNNNPSYYFTLTKEDFIGKDRESDIPDGFYWTRTVAVLNYGIYIGKLTNNPLLSDFVVFINGIDPSGNPNDQHGGGGYPPGAGVGLPPHIYSDQCRQ
jgi:hypothetical protein